jgi:hypothetical protein
MWICSIESHISFTKDIKLQHENRVRVRRFHIFPLMFHTLIGEKKRKRKVTPNILAAPNYKDFDQSEYQIQHSGC